MRKAVLKALPFFYEVVMNVVITGANRGIGLELTKIYVSRGCNVFALCRRASDELKKLGAEIYEDVVDAFQCIKLCG